MRSHGNGSMPATTQVKEFSPEIVHVAPGQGLHLPEANTGTIVKGEIVSGMPGSQSVAGKRTVYIGTWENQTVSIRSPQGTGKVTRGYVGLVVGLTHSRGVSRVMPAEPSKALEGVSSQMQREESCHAVH